MDRLNQINDIIIAPHFNLSEFACPCCQKVMLHPLLLSKLIALRAVLERPVSITSGYRCSAYNRKVGGVGNSYHCIGLAADIQVKEINLIDLLAYAEERDFHGIGFYEKKHFLHLDVRPTKKTRWRE
jgi:uncharacterized protein YcbK (DUF882 family)